MTQSNAFKLSDYQKAALEHMGISVWQVADAPALKADDDLEVVSQTSPSQISVPGKILCCFDNLDNHPIWQDILLAMNIDSTQVMYIGQQSIQAYVDYRAVCQLAAAPGVEGLSWQLPDVSRLSAQPSLKAQLWQQIIRAPL